MHLVDIADSDLRQRCETKCSDGLEDNACHYFKDGYSTDDDLGFAYCQGHMAGHDEGDTDCQRSFDKVDDHFNLNSYGLDSCRGAADPSCKGLPNGDFDALNKEGVMYKYGWLEGYEHAWEESCSSDHGAMPI